VILFHIYIDFRQAYGHINREKLYEAMIHFLIPVKIIRLVRLTMTSTESQVRVQTELKDSIATEQGLKQGDGLAPLLFNLALEFITNPHRFWPVQMTLLLSPGSCRMRRKYIMNWL
jgi:hypothetical protein